MSKKTRSQDSNSDFEKIWKEMEEIEPLTPIIDYQQAYIDAAKADAIMFGNYDAEEAYKTDRP